MELPGTEENEGKGDPPDQVVGQDRPAGLQGEALAEDGVSETDGTTDFAEETDEDDGPVAERIAGGGSVADAVDADDHADALPDFGIVGRG